MSDIVTVLQVIATSSEPFIRYLTLLDLAIERIRAVPLELLHLAFGRDVRHSEVSVALEMQKVSCMPRLEICIDGTAVKSKYRVDVPCKPRPGYLRKQAHHCSTWQSLHSNRQSPKSGGSRHRRTFAIEAMH